MLTTVSSCAPSTPLASSLPLFVLIGLTMTGMTGTNELQYIHVLIQVQLAVAGCKVQQSKQHHQSVPKQGDEFLPNDLSLQRISKVELN